MHHNPNSQTLMGFNQTLNFCIFLFLLLFLFSSFALSSSSSPLEIQPNAPSNVPTTQYRVFHIKNTTPFFLNKEDLNKNKKNSSLKKKNKKKMKRKKMNNLRTIPFSVMLPKGFVPPSGSSPCHNNFPDSIAFYCDFSTPKP